jgi:photosystem II stability/assembly factor-like uncharacterized protein
MKKYKVTVLSSLYFILIFSVYSYGQWNQITFPSNENLLMVRFVSEYTGWVVGENFVYKTTDSGTGWETQDSVLGTWCEALYAIDSLTLVYADSPRGIRRTSDGGTTWNTTDSENYYYFDFKFINDLLGFAACGSSSSTDSGIVRRTIDGGETWTTIGSVYLPNDGYDFEGISFVDSLNGWAVSYTGWVYNTTDGGFSWSFQDSVGLSNYFQYVPCRDIQFTTSDSGWVVGGLSGETLVARTTDGGQTWSTDFLYPFSSCSLREIEMINSQVGWFAGANNGGAMLAKTTDGGITWQDQLPFQAGFESISIVNENVGYAVGDNGRVYKTTNGGVNFIEEETSESQPEEFLLYQNYPNPFNPSTKIKFRIANTGFVNMKIYDVLGNEAATLINKEMQIGSYEVEFDASGLPSGIYFYKLATVPTGRQADSFVATKKMVLLR